MKFLEEIGFLKQFENGNYDSWKLLLRERREFCDRICSCNKNVLRTFLGIKVLN